LAIRCFFNFSSHFPIKEITIKKTGDHSDFPNAGQTDVEKNETAKVLPAETWKPDLKRLKCVKSRNYQKRVKFVHTSKLT
jgi:hypothetical protein